jgi:hypothetical protein
MNTEMDFTGEEFTRSQAVLNTSSKLNQLNKQIDEQRDQSKKVLDEAFGSDTELNGSHDIIQGHLDEHTLEEIQRMLNGSGKRPVPATEREDAINSFFTDENGEMLVLATHDTIQSTADELEFKRGLILYLKQSDYYIRKIDEEVDRYNKDMEEFTKEMNSEISDILNPLRDNILAYAEHMKLEAEKLPAGMKRRSFLKTATAIKSGYDFGILFDELNKHPNIMKNAIGDFYSNQKLRDIGKRYSDKLKSNKVEFNLFGFLSDKPEESLEYQILPKDSYPAGLEGFFAFFLIRHFSMGLTTPEDRHFHASVYVCLERLTDLTLDEDVAESVKDKIISLLELADEYRS